MPTELSAHDYRALFEFRHCIRSFLHFSADAAKRAGVEPQQHQLLLAIKATDGSAAEIGEIAEQLQVRHHSAVGLLNRTAAAGLVFRGRVESDRRHVCIRLTPAGETVLARLPEGHQHELRKDAPRLIRALERAISRRGEPERRE